jgi:hypothetical protein
MIALHYADDLVIGFEHKDDAQRFLDATRDRLGEFALSLHPAKTRLIEFGHAPSLGRSPMLPPPIPRPRVRTEAAKSREKTSCFGVR